MRSEIALVTASKMAVVDRESSLLVDALAELNCTASIVAWDADVDWSRFALVLIRSPWDYHERFNEFIRWAEATATKTRLLNQIEVLKWNSHKSYLLELQERGVPILSTVILKQGTTFDPRSLGRLLEEVPPGHDGLLIAKPAVGIGAHGIGKGHADDVRFQAHIRELLSQGDVLVQPFAPAIQDGEISLLFLGGVYSHAVRKIPAHGDFRVQSQHGGTNAVHHPIKREIDVAEKTIQAVPFPLAYARVDMVNWNGSPCVMELEVIEPELFLRFDDTSVNRFATYLAKQLP